ncbi:hypothetical protein [Pendulispora albinea]|uniref:RING-type E3 ubiquitin transferase n=1 Tax=Pendulispora albinea TaxID=2741071 RepID=A0ABZ2MA24_9BACT
MDILGWFLAFVGACGVVFGVLQMLKLKKMNRVPHRRPSEIVQLGPGAADAKRLVSTEGFVQPGQQQLFGPMSGQPCLAYEISVEVKWEKFSETEDGVDKTTGTDKVHTEAHGCQFYVTDGVGAVVVDSNGDIETSMEKTHSSTVDVKNVARLPTALQFGQMMADTPVVPDNRDANILAFVGTERILRPSPTLYALGQLDMAPHGPTLRVPKGIGTGKLILATKGRAHALKTAKRNMILGYALGGVLALGGTGAGLFAPKAEASAGPGACPAEIVDPAVDCDGRMNSREGKTYAWTLREAGHFNVKVDAPAVNNPIVVQVTLESSDGRKIAEGHGVGFGPTRIDRQPLEPGSYRLVIHDLLERDVQGGLGFHLSVEREAAPTEGEVDAAPSAAAVAPEPASSTAVGAAAVETMAAASAPVHSTHRAKPKTKASLHAAADAGKPSAPPKAEAPAPPPPPPPQVKAEPAPAPPPPPKAAPPPPKPAPPPEKKGVSLEVHFP